MDNRISILKKYQSFSDTSTMLDVVEKYVQSVHMTKSALKILRLIAFSAKNYPGATWLKIRTVCNHVKVSDSTARRSIRFLEKSGIITKVPTTREKQGGDGANIYIINPIEHANDRPQMTEREVSESPTDTTGSHANSKAKYVSFKSSSNAFKRIRKEEPIKIHQTLDSSFVREFVPDEFVSFTKMFFNEADKIEQLWGRVQLVVKKYNIPHLDIELVDESIAAFKQTVFACKQNRIRKGTDFDSFVGHFYGTLVQVLLKKIRAERLSKIADFYTL